MHVLVRALACALLVATCAAAGKPAAKARVSLELITEKGFPITGAQDWYRTFADLGVGGLRIRGANPGEQTGIEKRGSAEAPVYDVVGIIRADNSLVLPGGGKFTVRDGVRLKKWLADLADQGAEAVTQPRQAFGLTPSQLVEVDADLKGPVTFATSGLTAAEAAQKIGQGLGHALEIDSAAKGALEAAKVEDELAGISCGTALAVVLRPAGLVFRPERPSGGALTYRVSKPAEGREAWPAGWKPNEPEQKIVPEMYTKLINVEIDQTPVIEAVDALRKRLKLPVLWDRSALERHGIDPAKIEVKLPPKKLTYSLILQRVLSQARLKKEIRVDEAGKPFVWITTIKPS